MSPLPRTTSDQRLPLYEDVESLITVGFLSHPIVVNGTQLVVRSLGPGDLFLLQSRTQNSSINWEVWTIATAIWLANGHSLLGESQNVPMLAQRLQRLPPRARDILFSIVMGLFTRQSKAVDATESYCYESISRFRWRSYGGHFTPQHAGIPGVEALGTNYVQRMWAFFNEMEDQRVRDETYWEGLKLIASTQSPKGAKKLDQRDKQLWESELGRRQAVQDKFYYLATGILSPEQVEAKKSMDALSLPSKTPEQLEEEMRRWVAGEEDAHDKIVNAYKEKITAQHEAEKAEREKRAAALRERLAMEESSARHPSPLVGYTQEQLAQILREREVGQPGGRVIHVTDHGSRDFLYEKYLKRSPDSGLLVADGEKLAKREPKDLTEEVASRRVQFRTEPGEGE